MKKSLLLPVILLSACSGRQVPGTSTLNSEMRSADLGTAFNQHTNEIAQGQHCVAIDPSMIQSSLPNVVNFGIKMNMDASTASDILTGSGGVTLDHKIVSATGNMKFTLDNSSSDLSSTITGFLYTSGGERKIGPPIDDKKVQLTAGVASLLDEGSETLVSDLNNICGTHYISSVQYGSVLAVTFKIDWQDRAAKEQFDGSISGTLKTDAVKGTLTAQLEKTLKYSKRAFNISVNFQGQGMNALKIGDIIPDGQKVTKCQGTTPDDCLNIFADLLDSMQDYRNIVTSSPSGSTPAADSATDDSDTDGTGFVESLPIDPKKVTEDALSNMMVTGFTKLPYQTAHKKDDVLAFDWPTSTITSGDLGQILQFRKSLTREYTESVMLANRASLLTKSNDERIDEKKLADLKAFTRSIEEFQTYLLQAESPCYDLAQGAKNCLTKRDLYHLDVVSKTGRFANFDTGVLSLPRNNFTAWCSDYNLRLAAAEDVPGNLILPDSAKITIDVILRTLYPKDAPATSLKDGSVNAVPTSQLTDEKVAKSNYQIKCDAFASDVMSRDTLDFSKTRKVITEIPGTGSADTKPTTIATEETVGMIRSLEPLFSLQRARTLILDNQQVDPTQLKDIRNLTALQHLSIRNAGLTDIGGIRYLPGLVTLNLEQNSLTSFIIPRLSRVSSTTATNQGLLSLVTLGLANNRSLNSLDLAGLVAVQEIDLRNSYNNSFFETINVLGRESNASRLTVKIDDDACADLQNKMSSSKIQIVCGVNDSLAGSFVLIKPHVSHVSEFAEGSMHQGWQFRKDNRIAGKGDFNNDGLEEIVILDEFRIGLLQKSNEVSAMLDDSNRDKSKRTTVGTFVFDSSRVKLMAIGDFTGDGRADLLLSKSNEGIYLLSVKNFTTNEWILEGFSPFSDTALRPHDRILGVANFDSSTAALEIAVESQSPQEIRIYALSTGKSLTASTTPVLSIASRKAWPSQGEFLGIGKFVAGPSSSIAVLNQSEGKHSIAFHVFNPNAGPEVKDVERKANFDAQEQDTLAGIDLATSKPVVFDSDSDGIDELIVQHDDGIAWLGFEAAGAEIKILPWGTALTGSTSNETWILAPTPSEMLQDQKIGTAGNYDSDPATELALFSFSHEKMRMGIFNIDRKNSKFLSLSKVNTLFTFPKAPLNEETKVVDSSQFEFIDVNHDGGMNQELFLHVIKGSQVKYRETPFVNYLSYCMQPSLARETWGLSALPNLSGVQLNAQMQTTLGALAAKAGHKWQDGFDACVAINKHLKNVGGLDLSTDRNLITDLRPLLGLDNLEVLITVNSRNLDKDRDTRFVEPLATLTSLKYLDLRNAGIKDTELLKPLYKLQVLNLYGNAIPEEKMTILDEYQGDYFFHEAGKSTRSEYCEHMTQNGLRTEVQGAPIVDPSRKWIRFLFETIAEDCQKEWI